MDHRQEIIRPVSGIDDSWILWQIYRCIVNIWGDSKKEDPLTEQKQMIMSRIQNVRNPELLTKITTFVECWTDDEGGITDER